MSGCHPINTDPCLCACHKMGGSGIQNISNCCKCTQQLGYSPIEKLQVCKHGRPLKFGCTQCYCAQFQSHAPKFDKSEENVSPIIKQIQELEERINKAEKIISELVDKITEIANFYYKEKKTPHKCPLCEGSGLGEKYAEVLIDGVKIQDRYKPCNGCEGKGIVWN